MRMENAVEIRGLYKSFGSFEMRDLDLDIPQGYVVGLIGENGAGKTTLIKCITGANIIDSGSIRIFGSEDRTEIDGRVGVVFDECHLFQQMTGAQIGKLMSTLFGNWDQTRYSELMSTFGIPEEKKLKEYSRGMRMKIQVAVALSHNPELVIMDEATAGMDPAARDEFLDLVMDYMQDENHTVLMSSHITSDLERIADYIVFIHKGRIVMNGPKDEILENYGIAKGSERDILAIGRENIISLRREELSTSALVADRKGVAEAFPELVVDPASLDDIMVMVIRGDAA